MPVPVPEFGDVAVTVSVDTPTAVAGDVTVIVNVDVAPEPMLALAADDVAVQPAGTLAANVSVEAAHAWSLFVTVAL